MIQTVNKYPIDEIFKSDGNIHYFIPKYQREYTWGYNDWNNMFSDLLENDEGYFIGSIICINTGDSNYPKLEVIDGQQRLTTLCLFLAAIYTRINIWGDLTTKKIIVEMANLEGALLRKSCSSNGLVLVPQVQNSNLEDFNYVMKEAELISSATKIQYYGNRKMARCFHHFQYLIDQDLEGIEDKETKVERLLQIKKKVLRAVLVKIEVSSASDAYILFESLNNRGTPLTAIDLMKNLIMARAEKAGISTDDCFNQWQSLLNYLTDDYATQERFFRHYYNAFKNRLNEPFRSSDSKKKDPLGYVATKSNLLSIFEKIINRDLTGFLKDILTCGEIYSQFIKFEDQSGEVKKALGDLDHIQAVPSYMLLLYLQHDAKELKLDEKQYVRIIKLLTLYFVRRNTTDYPGTRDLTRIFMKLIETIESNSAVRGAKIFDFIRAYLEESCAPDDLFEKSLRGDIYKENSGAARYLLCSLAEKYMTSEKWTNLWRRNEHNIYVWTIEHIFPEGNTVPVDWVNMIADGDQELAQEYLDKYVHKIGNLTITGFNSKLSNYAFIRKRDYQDKSGNYIGYKNGLEINAEIAVKDTWTINDITARTEKLVKELLAMFKYPEQ